MATRTATRISDTNGSAATASSLALPSYSIGSTGMPFLVGVVAYNDSWLGNPATSFTFGSDALQFYGAKASGPGNVSCEAWYAAGANTTTAQPTVSWPGGTSLSIGAAFMEISNVGIHGPIIGTDTASGLVSPISITWTSSPTLGGLVLETDNIVLAMGVMYTAGSGATMSATGGTAFMTPTTIGAGAAQITCAAAFDNASGGPDAFSWSESVATEWCELLIDVCGSALTGILRAGNALPLYH